MINFSAHQLIAIMIIHSFVTAETLFPVRNPSDDTDQLAWLHHNKHFHGIADAEKIDRQNSSLVIDENFSKLNIHENDQAESKLMSNVEHAVAERTSSMLTETVGPFEYFTEFRLLQAHDEPSHRPNQEYRYHPENENSNDHAVINVPKEKFKDQFAGKHSIDRKRNVSRQNLPSAGLPNSGDAISYKKRLSQPGFRYGTRFPISTHTYQNGFHHQSPGIQKPFELPLITTDQTKATEPSIVVADYTTFPNSFVKMDSTGETIYHILGRPGYPTKRPDSNVPMKTSTDQLEFPKKKHDTVDVSSTPDIDNETGGALETTVRSNDNEKRTAPPTEKSPELRDNLHSNESNISTDAVGFPGILRASEPRDPPTRDHPWRDDQTVSSVVGDMDTDNASLLTYLFLIICVILTASLIIVGAFYVKAKCEVRRLDTKIRKACIRGLDQTLEEQDV